VPQGAAQLWLALAASSTLAGNATILGAACNVVVVQGASREGVSVTMKDFVKAGLPVTAATLIVSTVLIALLVPAWAEVLWIPGCLGRAVGRTTDSTIDRARMTDSLVW